jgi:hypothetical protein
VDAGLKKQHLDYYGRDMLRYDPYKKQLRFAEEGDYFIELQ